MKTIILILSMLLPWPNVTTHVRDTYTCTPTETWPMAAYGSHPVCYEV